MNLMIGEGNSSAARPEAPEIVPVDVISYATSKCRLGHVLVARSAKGVCAILMGDDGVDLEADLAASFPKATLVSVQDDLAKVQRFLERPADGLHLTLERRGTPFQRRV
jgi:AraC family transcriptional regulator of adaptative response/methylated-DNA-[protein]-cysteine methyltransferase